jgi:hypothetical protein
VTNCIDRTFTILAIMGEAEHQIFERVKANRKFSGLCTKAKKALEAQVQAFFTSAPVGIE